MEILERIWEIVAAIGNAILGRFERAITGLFGSANARFLKRLQPKVEAIGALEPKYQAMTDAELRAQTAEFRRRLEAGETLDDILVEAFAVCREGGSAIHRPAPLRRAAHGRHDPARRQHRRDGHRRRQDARRHAARLSQRDLDGKGVHVVTVNDYLARRDMEWMGPLYTGLGLTVGAIQAGMDSAERQKSYACDITYGTNNEFGFDYLRDNMRIAARGDDRYPKHQQQAQGPLHFAIIDEVDNILIDEARTPLIISGPAEDDVTKYQRADKVARQLKKDVHFEVKEKEHTANLTDEGVREAERLAGVESFYTAGNMQWPHLIDNSLKAHHLYKRDVNYVVQDGEVVIVDEFTGRLMPGRHWSDGLHQAVEAKEGVHDQGREPDARHDHAAKLLQAVRQDLRHDGHRPHRGRRVLENLQARRDRRAHQQAAPPHDSSGRHLPQRAGKVHRHRRRDRAAQSLDDQILLDRWHDRRRHRRDAKTTSQVDDPAAGIEADAS